MGRPKKEQAAVEMEPEGVELFGEFDGWIDKIREECGEAPVQVTVFRVDPETGSVRYCGKLAAEHFSMEAIRERWGGGRFRPKVSGRGGKYLRSIDPFDIEGLPKIDSPEKDIPVNPTGLAAEIAELRELVKQALGQKPTQQPDMLTMIKEVAAVVGSLQQGRAPAPVGPLGVGEAVALLRQGIEIGREGGGGDSDGFAGVIEKALPFIQDLWAAAKSKNGNGGGGPMTIDGLLQAYVPQVVKWAVGGAPADVCADRLLSNIPPKYYEQVYDAITRTDLINKVLAMAPELREREAWVREFFAEVVSQTGPDDTPVAGESVEVLPAGGGSENDGDE